jgi:hypothetical protein
MGRLEHELIRPIQQMFDLVIPKLTKGMAEGQVRYARHLEDAADAFERTDKSHVSPLLHPDQIKAFGDSKTGDVTTGPGQAVFWTGRTRNGPDPESDFVDAGERNGHFLAQEFARSRGTTTLEGLIEDRGIAIPAWSKDKLVQKRWMEISTRYASGVSGDVYVVMGRSVRKGAVWHEEFKALKRNVNVTRVIKVDLTTGRESVIHARSPG